MGDPAVALAEKRIKIAEVIPFLAYRWSTSAYCTSAFTNLLLLLLLLPSTGWTGTAGVILVAPNQTIMNMTTSACIHQYLIQLGKRNLVFSIYLRLKGLCLRLNGMVVMGRPL